MIDEAYDIRQGDTRWKKRLAKDEIIDIPGLSKIRNILKKYNLTSVTIDHKLNVVVRHMKGYNPKTDLEKEKLQ